MTNEDLWQLILDIENEMCAEGMSPKDRHFHLPIKAMERLGYRSFALGGRNEPPLYKRIRKLHGTLYRMEDVAVGGIHGGAFMFRGIATHVYVPLILGKVKVEPFKYNDLSPEQLNWMISSPADRKTYYTNFCNLFDFAACLYPMEGFGKVPETALPRLQLAAFQSQSAAATLCAAYDTRGAIQSSLLAAELSMKAALEGDGARDSDLIKHGHNLKNLADAVGKAYDVFDLATVREHINTLPQLVPNRYSLQQPDRNKTGKIVMASQAIVGAVARALTNFGFDALVKATHLR